ncbi:MAG: hypothetical protein A2413_03935 [Treponema sp. RIFOXYC1_FULL_61_9]|nr:MAG: hypothetical protein A2001_17740 [Treponema sp. GWC1_61_84]OHE72465.1 MAG: hypothetical protein A2413_03935 [Treponema sp. RIFOXYC1_FULL_61_9]
MKIIYFTDVYWPRVNGVTVSIQTFSDALRRLGHEVLIVCPEYPRERFMGTKAEAEGVFRIPSVGFFFSKEDRISVPMVVPDLFERFDAFGADVVHMQTEFSIGMLGRRYCRSRGYPIISTCHTHYEQYFEHYFPGLPPRLGRALTRASMRGMYRGDDAVIVPARQIERVLRGYGVNGKFFMIPTGVDENTFAVDADRDLRVRRYLTERFPAIRDCPLLLFVGRVGQEKNVSFLFSVMKKIREAGSNAKLVLVGDGPARTHLEKMTVEQGVGDLCVFSGYLAREDLPSVYAMADVFVFPSKTETQGLVTIEAMLCGTPVVAIGEMGTADVMAGDNGGFMVRDDTDEFTARVLQLLGDPALRARKSAEALEFSKRWTVGRMTDALLAVYDQAAAGRRKTKHTLFARIRRFLVRTPYFFT